MNLTYETATKIMCDRFGKDSLIAIATMDGEGLHNRIVDAYFDRGSFYITSNALSTKVKQIEANPDVAICSIDWFTGHGKAKNRGWILAPENAEIRLKLREAFSAWYDMANNEQDKNCCIIEIRLTDGMLIKDHHALRYKIDFLNEVALLSENFGEFK